MSDATTVAAAFDLEQVLLSPYGQTGAFYYSRRLKNHNFTVTEIDTMFTYAFLWNEHECKKGSCEIATCLRLFLKNCAEKGIKKVYLLCDCCGGQNQNRPVFIALSKALIEFKFELIELLFLVSGHSHSENDNAHSVIEA